MWTAIRIVIFGANSSASGSGGGSSGATPTYYIYGF